MGELWGVCPKDLGENLQYYNGTTQVVENLSLQDKCLHVPTLPVNSMAADDVGKQWAKALQLWHPSSPRT